MKKTWMFIVKLFAVIAVIITVGIVIPQSDAYAATTATPIKVVSVEYYEEQIVVLNNDNSKICFATESDAARDNWEVINADSGKFTTIDMSWLSPTIENIIVIKGYDDTTDTKSRVIFAAKPAKLEVSISYSNMDSLITSDPDASIAPLVNIMTSIGTGDDPIDFTDLEWRKGTSGQWKQTDELTVSLLEKYIVKGTYLYFRIRAVDDVVDVTSGSGTVDFDARRVNGKGGILSYFEENPSITDPTGVLGTNYSNGTDGRRFSNEIKVKVAKKSSATGYGIDGEDFTADIKYGKEYRVTLSGATSDWIQVTDRTVKTIPLSTIVKGASSSATYDGTTAAKAFPAMKIEVRDYATSKSASSKITETTLNAQRTITGSTLDGPAPEDADTTDKNIYISYNGNKNLVLEIPSASSTQPYEYTVVKPSDSFNLTKATWSQVTKGTAVKILASKAVDNGTLYIRKKEIKAKNATSTSDAVDFELASTYVTTEIKYPSTPDIVDANYIFTKGYSSDITFMITLNANGKEAYESEVKTIKLGTKEIAFTQTPATSGGVKTLTVTLKAESLTALTNCYVKPITITYKNGTIDKTSIKLTIQNSASATSLTAIHAKATNTGTAFNVVTSKNAGNSWVYVITDAAISGVNIQDKVTDKTTATQTTITSASVDDVAITAGKYLTIFEVNSAGYIVKYKSIQINAEYIK